MEPDWQAVADALTEQREKIGMSWAELARRAGLSPRTVERISRAEANPRPTTLAAISRTVGWPPDALKSVSEGNPAPLSREDQLEREIAHLRELTERLEAVLDEQERR